MNHLHEVKSTEAFKTTLAQQYKFIKNVNFVKHFALINL